MQVDSTVKAFDAFNSDSLFILGTDGNLWEAQGPFGNVPPARQLGAENVRAFLGVAGYPLVWALSAGILFSDSTPFPPTTFQAIGEHVLAFQPIESGAQGFFLTSDGVLYQWYGGPQQSTLVVDTDVMEFSATDGGNVLVLKTDGSLWWDQPQGLNPTKQTLIDTNVA